MTEQERIEFCDELETEWKFLDFKIDVPYGQTFVIYEQPGTKRIRVVVRGDYPKKMPVGNKYAREFLFDKIVDDPDYYDMMIKKDRRMRREKAVLYKEALEGACEDINAPQGFQYSRKMQRHIDKH